MIARALYRYWNSGHVAVLFFRCKVERRIKAQDANMHIPGWERRYPFYMLA